MEKNHLNTYIDIIHEAKPGKHLIALSPAVHIPHFLKNIQNGRTVGFLFDDKKYTESCLQNMKSELKSNHIILIPFSVLSSDSFSCQSNIDDIIFESAEMILSEEGSNIVNQYNPDRIFGIIASVYDERNYENIYDDIIFSHDLTESVRNEQLPAVSLSILENNNQSKLPESVLAFIENSKSIHALVYYQDIKTLKDISYLNQKANAPAVFLINESTNRKNLEEIFGKFASASHACIFTNQILPYDINLNITDVFVSFRSSESIETYGQMITPCLSQYPDKSACKIYDIVSGISPVTVVSLVGESYKYFTEYEKLYLKQEHSLSNVLHVLQKNILPLYPDMETIRVIIDNIQNESKEKANAILYRPDTVFKYFDNIRAYICPHANTRYKICLYNGYIFMSEPNVLNQVCLTVYTYNKYYHVTTSLTDAVEIMSCVCVTHKDNEYLWSAEIEKLWNTMPITDAQIMRVKRIHIKDVGDSSISKAQASNLIFLDYNLQMINRFLLKRGVIISKRISEKKIKEKEACAVAAYHELLKERETLLKEGKENFPEFYNRILNNSITVQNYKIQTDKSLWENNDPITLHKIIKIGNIFSTSKKASIHQKNYIHYLTEDFREDNILFDDALKDINSETKANIEIRILSELRNMIPTSHMRQKYNYKDIIIGTESVEKSVANSCSKEISINVDIFKK